MRTRSAVAGVAGLLAVLAVLVSEWSSEAEPNAGEGPAVAVLDADGDDQSTTDAVELLGAPRPAQRLAAPGQTRGLEAAAPELGAHTTVRVLDDADRPISGAAVALTDATIQPQTHGPPRLSDRTAWLQRLAEQSTSVGFAHTGDDGLAHVDVLIDGPASVLAESPGYLPGVRQLDGPAAPGSVVELTLSRGSALSGTVHAADGTPVEAAALAVSTPTGRVVDCSTDAAGTYRVSGLPLTGSLDVACAAQGLSSHHEVVTPDIGTLDIVLLDRQPMDALLVDARTGNTLLDQRVDLSFDLPRSAAFQALAVPNPSGQREVVDGHARIDSLDALITCATAQLPGYHRASFDPFEPGLRVPFQRVEDVELSVVDARTGRPVQRAVIELVTTEPGERPGEQLFRYHGFDREQHSARGQFLIGGHLLLSKQRALYRVRAPGFAPSEQLVLMDAGVVPGTTSVLVALEPEEH